MERKDYLVEKLSNEEKAYLKKIILSARKKYIRDNYDYVNSISMDLSSLESVEAESVLDAVVLKCEKEIKSAVEFENLISNNKMYEVIKALSLREKMMLFSLYKEDKPINQVADEMKISRITAWRIKSEALDKVMKAMLGGK